MNNIEVSKVLRRGAHVMFDVYITEIKGATKNEVQVTRGKHGTASVAGYKRTRQRTLHTWARVDGQWNGSEVVLGEVQYSKLVYWKEAEEHVEEVLQRVRESHHMERITKILQKARVLPV